MARIRTLKPELPQSESMGRVSRDARLCFVLLFTVVDDAGRTRASSRLLASLLFPYDGDAGELIGGWLDELDREGCIARYDIDGNSYLQITNWLKHQKIDKPSPSRLPAFVESSRKVANGSEASATYLVPVPSTKDLVPGKDISLPTEAHPKAALVGDGLGQAYADLIQRSFVLFCKLLGRSAKQYTLTEKRRKKAMSRLKERLAVHEGDLQAVEEEFRRAIENLASSEWNRENGHIDWTDQIFKDAETFEKRLNWQKPIGGSNGRTGNYSKAKSNGTANAFYRSVEEDSDQDDAWQPSGDAASGDRGTGLQGLQRISPTLRAS